ncbi:hypothetical protein RGU12_14030 [Fredinandcohnia sp. QZ13]|uniref:hypothetical protein n=1 Tax=Fredinandcohnia sp. QZ13 TaxID=3073144 RepID=UPI002853290B|nr:hypothetical protein [Fredinandcohnia sp. QZ13]MDR4888629.1 hypothetical protein [Fredinandcohnia sp. QZ13]
MFRYNYNGKELIIRFTSQTKNMNLNKDDLYNKIISICDKILDADHGTSFIVEDDEGRFAVGTVQHGELTVISIHHLVEQTQMYFQRREAKKPS